MTSLPERNIVLALVNEAMDSGARQEAACNVIELSERTLQRWKIDQANEIADRRTDRVQTPHNQLSSLERQHVLRIANSAEFGHLPPSQIVPRPLGSGQSCVGNSDIRSLTVAARIHCKYFHSLE